MAKDKTVAGRSQALTVEVGKYYRGTIDEYLYVGCSTGELEIITGFLRAIAIHGAQELLRNDKAVYSR